jgi:hypothetical protein
MTRIYCKTPSTGRTKNYTRANVGTEWVTLAEAPDFSVPDASRVFPNRDTDDNRAVRPGEVFFMTPIYARNKSASACWIETQLLLEEKDSMGNEIAISCPGRMNIPAGDTALIPIQGRSLLKRLSLDNSSSSGDRLQVCAQTPNSLDVWASGEEKPSAEHIGVTA